MSTHTAPVITTTSLKVTTAGLLVLLTAAAWVSPRSAAWVSPRCGNFAVGIGDGPEVPTPVLTSTGELCEIIEESDDGRVVISGRHDDFGDYAHWMLDQLTADPEAISAQDRELIAYLQDCLSEKASVPVGTP